MRSPPPEAVAYLLRVKQLIGLGVVSQRIGIGIGIEPTDPVFAALLADRVATLSELRQHGHKTIEPCLLLIVVVCGQRLARWQHVLNRSALQRPSLVRFQSTGVDPRSSL